jgi:hypothetical protein
LKYRCAIKMKPASIPQVLYVVLQFINQTCRKTSFLPLF